MVYPALPDQIPTHWNIRGEIDDTGAKSWAAFAGPGLMTVWLGLFLALPWLSPRPFQVEGFRSTYNYLMLLLTGLFAFLHVVMLQAALHPRIDWGRVLVGGLFVFLALTGNVLGRTQRNFWIGVRTPWTLANEEVWTSTHRLAARLLVACGIAGAVLIALGLPVGWGFALLLAALLVPVVHSLLRYKELEREGRA
jgi:uncharacterized membrane protein